MSNSHSNSLQTPGKEIEGAGERERGVHNKLAKLLTNRGQLLTQKCKQSVEESVEEEERLPKFGSSNRSIL